MYRAKKYKKTVAGKGDVLNSFRFLVWRVGACLVFLTVISTSAMGQGYIWNPSHTNIMAWYDASESSTITDTGGVVTEWANKSTNGLANFPFNDVDAAGRGPTTGSRTINGLNVLDFDGTNFLTARRNDYGVKFYPPYSLFMVAAIDDADDASDAIFGFHRETATHFSFWSRDTVFSGRLNGSQIGAPSVNLTGGPYEGGTNIFNAVFDTTASTLSAYVDGTVRASSSGLTGISPRAVYLFRQRGGNNSPDGAVGEFILMRDCSTEARQKIEGYLAHKWGLAGNLPSDHPYRRTPPWLYPPGTVLVFR